jgi:hypothetical protein
LVGAPVVGAGIYEIVFESEGVDKMVGSPSYQTFRKWSWIVIDAIGARRHDVVSCVHAFYFFYELSLSNCLLLFINRYAEKLDSEGTKVGFARFLLTVWIVLFRSPGPMRGGKTRISTRRKNMGMGCGTVWYGMVLYGMVQDRYMHPDMGYIVGEWAFQVQFMAGSAYLQERFEAEVKSW